MIELDINGLYHLAFGSERGLSVEGIGDSIINEAEAGDISIIKKPGASALLYDSRLKRVTPIGTSLFMPMMIGGVQLPNEPTVVFNIKKKFVETSLYGSKRRGNVIEDMAVESYSLTIKGVAINYNDSRNYPADQVRQLNELFLRRGALEIVSPMTKLLGIDFVALRNFNLPEMIGVQHAQAYQFQAVEDQVFLLEEE